MRFLDAIWLRHPLVLISLNGCPLASLTWLQNDSVQTLLARVWGIFGPLPRWMVAQGRFAHKYFSREGRLFERNAETVR